MNDIDKLAQEIRRVDGSNSLGAGALAEALMPFLRTALAKAEAERDAAHNEAAKSDGRYPSMFYSEDKDGRVGVAHYNRHDGWDAFVTVSTLLENKPGGWWKDVHLQPDEAEQMALHLLEKVKAIRALKTKE